MIEIRFHGRGGQGAFTAAKILGASAILEGNYALAFPSFGPERRGAPIQAFTKIDDKPIVNRTEIKKCDYIIFLDETLYSSNVLDDLKEGGRIIINSCNRENYIDSDKVISIDADKLAMGILNVPITNTAMLGGLLGISKLVNIDSVEIASADYLPINVLNKNIQIIEKAYAEVTK